MEGRFVLAWNKDSMSDGYIIRQQVEDEFTELVRVENTDITSIVIPDIKEGVENHIQVSFFYKKSNEHCIYKNEEYYLFIVSGQLIVYRFPTPKLKMAKKTEDSVIVKWEKIPDEVTYVVSRKALGGAWKRIGMTKENYYVDNEADITLKYIYNVRCVSEDGKKNLSNCAHNGIVAE